VSGTNRLPVAAVAVGEIAGNESRPKAAKPPRPDREGGVTQASLQESRPVDPSR
jgi:hypothetical protein